MKKIALLIILSFFLFTSHAQIVNEGVLKIESGTSVYFKNDFTNKAGATHTNDGDLHLNGDFINNGIVTTTAAASGTTFFDSTDDKIQNIFVTDDTNTTQFHNLTVDNAESNGNSLAVSDIVGTEEGVNLIVTHVLDIKANKKLRLIDQAQLIQKNNATNLGTGHLLKDQDGALNTYRYNYWSSPVKRGTTYKVTEVLKDGTSPNTWSPAQVGFTTALNGSTSPFELSTRWFWKYVNGNIDPWNDNGWLSLFNLGTTTESANAAINPGEGFCMKGPDASGAQFADQNYTFQGEPNNGTISLAIAANKEYLVGNPYASALDLNVFLNDNASGGTPVLNGTIYYYEHWSDDTHYYSQYGAGYATYNGSGGLKASLHPHFAGGAWAGTEGEENIPQRYLPVGQGFIVRSANAGNIVFNNAQRIFNAEGITSIFFSPNSSEEETNTFTNGVTSRIYLGYTEPTLRHRHLLFALTDDSATDDFDNMYDGEMIDLGENDLYFTIGDTDEEIAIPYVIQGVGAYNINAEYPLVVKTATSGKHIIMIDELENFNEDLYILDEKGNTFNLRDGDYDFYTSTNETERHLKLVFKPASSPTDVQDNINEFITAFYVKDEIIIKNDQNLTLTGLQVYNAIGQLVLQTNNKNQLKDALVHIPFTNFAKSAYVIKLQAVEGSGTYKFINY